VITVILIGGYRGDSPTAVQA